MSDEGCFALALLFFAFLFFVVIAAFLNRDKNVARKKRERGERITELVEESADASRYRKVADELNSLLQMEPVGYVPDLVGPGGWFQRVSATLTTFSRDISGFILVEWYFRCFSFVAGSQAEVLQWFAPVFGISSTGPAATFLGAANRRSHNLEGRAFRSCVALPAVARAGSSDERFAVGQIRRAAHRKN